MRDLCPKRGRMMMIVPLSDCELRNAAANVDAMLRVLMGWMLRHYRF